MEIVKAFKTFLLLFLLLAICLAAIDLMQVYEAIFSLHVMTKRGLCIYKYVYTCVT